MPRRVADRPWSDYRVGIIITAVIVLVGISIFVVGSAAGPFAPETYTYFVDLDDAAGIRVGSIVRVGGVDAGEVIDVAIVPARVAEPEPFPADTLRRPEALRRDVRDVRLTLAIQETFVDNITSSSRAQLAMLGVGAERYVKVTAGNVRERPLPPGSTIPTIASIDLDLVLGRLARAFNETKEIAALADQIRAKVSARRGSVGLLLDADAELYGEIRALEGEARSLLEMIDHGPGFVALYRHDRTLQASLDSLSANLATIQAAVRDSTSGLTLWTERTALDQALTDLRAEVAAFDARLAGGRGTLGRLAADQELWIQVRILEREIAELVEAFKADPLGFVNIEIF